MLERLGHALAAEDAAGVLDTLATGVTLRVAVHDQPFEGLPAATQILHTVLDGVLHDIELGEPIDGPAAGVLMFTTRVARHPGRADGLLVARSDADGRICDLTVFLRPLIALQALADEMGRRLGAPAPTGERA